MNSIKKIKTIDNLEFFTVSVDSKKEIPFIDTMVSAGFPSPADDYLDLPIDLNEYLVENSAATFYIRVSGNSMQDEGIDDGDLLVVDRSKTPKNNDIVIGVLFGYCVFGHDGVFIVSATTSCWKYWKCSSCSVYT